MMNFQSLCAFMMLLLLLMAIVGLVSFINNLGSQYHKSHSLDFKAAMDTPAFTMLTGGLFMAAIFFFLVMWEEWKFQKARPAKPKSCPRCKITVSESASICPYCNGPLKN